ncbi:MAG TPA: glycosyltransferase family 4 protein [Gammaproteobacteria bacterium]
MRTDGTCSGVSGDAAAADAPPVLILTPDLRGNVGGVANYYNVLRLHEIANVEYFYVNRAEPESPLARVARLAANYVRFVGKLLRRDYALLHFNPSLNAKSFFRDGVFLLLARLSHAPRLIFFRGWEEPFAERIARRAVLRAFFRLAYGTGADYAVLGRRFEAGLRRLGVRGGRVFIETTVADARPSDSPRAERVPAAHGRRPREAPTERAAALFMSRLLVAKGALIAIDAVRRYRERRPPVLPSLDLWIAGAGDDEAAIRAHVERTGCDFVRFLGHVTGDAKWRALEDADVFLFPTCYPEGLSNAVLEAMLHGLPIVTRPEGALGEVLVDGVHGVVSTSTDPDYFAERLLALLADPDAYRRIAARNRDEAEQRFTRERVAARLLEIYAAVREGRHST